MSSTARQIVFWVLILLGVLLIFKAFTDSRNRPENIDFVALSTKVQRGEITRLTVKQNEILAEDVNGKQLRAESANPYYQSKLMEEAAKLDPDTNRQRAVVEDRSGGGQLNFRPGLLGGWLLAVFTIAAGVFLGGALLRVAFPRG